MTTLKTKVKEDMKQALKAKDQKKLSAIRLILAAIKQKEIDDRVELDDAAVIRILEKMCKQRQESLAQYEKFNRLDLAEQEAFEIKIINAYLPEQMNEADLIQFIDKAIRAVEAAGLQDMGKMMAYIKKEAPGRVDMGLVSQKVKERLTFKG